MWIVANAESDEAIVEMCQQLYREDPAPRPVPPEQTRATLAFFRANQSRGRALVLEVNGKFVGYALLASFWSNELGGEICTLDEFFVSKDVRGKGFGRALLKELTGNLGRLWPAGVKAFDLEVTPDNLRAKEFYKTFGFKPAKNSHLRLRF